MTHSDPSHAVRLYGTEELPIQERLAGAGPLSVLFDGANLRDIRMHGEEVIRAISFVVRDKDWATLIPEIVRLVVEEDDDRFRITYRAGVASKGETFEYEVAIQGDAAGVLTYSARGNSPTGLLTNRTGFVVLHPIEGVSGAPATITHTNGQRVATGFPVEIDPVQPMMDLREISHRTPGGLEVSCLMEGDAFEMEDQRNWTDASYKTYVRPLALPWPYRIEPGDVIGQKITLTVKGSPKAPSRGAGGPVVLTLGEAEGTIPSLGIGLQPEDASAALRHVETLHQLGVAHIICHHDPRRSHDAETLARQVEAAIALGAHPWLEAVVEHVDDAGAAAEIDALGKVVAKLDHRFTTVLVSPAPDLKCTLPGSVWPLAPAPAKLYAATRAAFPGSRIGGGMFSFFTELNRKRPPTEAIDLVTFTTAAIFHAGDDRSLMETLECLPHIARTVPAIATGLPYSVGPSAIGLRDNPYGAAPVANPGNIRQAVNFNDPRQRGIMGAAWNLGYFAAFAEGGAEAIALGGAVGPFGVLSVPMPFPQPWFEGKGELYPIWHIARGLAKLKGCPIRSLRSSVAGAVRGIAAVTEKGIELWLCNPSPNTVEVRLPEDFTTAAILDASSFVAASRQPDLLDRLTPVETQTLSLDSYAVVRALRQI
ncbi:MAG: hypothetical protein EOQ39_12465 [Mesorhizobium sp.]|uniref:hypothetical protein n=1 Tax=Mesorhizobium sp. TaxID=1871066 RepID=UPI000FE807DB|nr:hypothetical protein [Mesorhizobium sp.]RWB10057.1 MAG: hypothetical protein EOQ37_02570 [Mesorhizobium sp.]RWB15226.1 MAG: hypothetical protein EOQ39_12465 [Mesorhizobium sp.]